MKNKSFDCVEMKRKGAEVIYQKVASLSIEQQLEYWRKGSDSLRKQMKPTKHVEKELGDRELAQQPNT
jgi:hypothetical protein